MANFVNRALTDRERFALDYEAHYNTGQWVFIYLMSREKQPKSEKPNTIRTAASAWKNTNIVKEYYQAAQIRERAKLQAEIENYIKQNTLQVENANGVKSVAVLANGDTLGEAEIIRELTRLVKFGQLDDQQKVAALVKLGEYQRKSDGAAEDTQIHRFYTPLQCKSCVLYRRAQRQLPDNQHNAEASQNSLKMR